MISLAIKRKKSLRWLLVIFALDLMVMLAAVLGFSSGVVTFQQNIFSLFVFCFLLGFCNVWFICEYLLLKRQNSSEYYKNSYENSQIRFAFICHIGVQNNKSTKLFINSHNKLRKCFYKTFIKTKNLYDSIAVNMSIHDGVFNQVKDFEDQIKESFYEHPIADVYYMGIPQSNQMNGILSFDLELKGSKGPGYTLLYVCETSYEFYEKHMEPTMRRMLQNRSLLADKFYQSLDARPSSGQLHCTFDLIKLPISLS